MSKNIQAHTNSAANGDRSSGRILSGARRLVGAGIHELWHVTQRNHNPVMKSVSSNTEQGDQLQLQPARPTGPTVGRRASKRLPDSVFRQNSPQGDEEDGIERDYWATNSRFIRAALWPVEARSKLRIGKVTVRVVEAAYLPWGPEGMPSPYCVVEVEDRGWQTRTERKNDSPTWHGEPVEFYVSRHDAVVAVQVLDEGDTHDDRLGLAELKVEDYAGLGNTRRWYSLRTLSGEPAGSVHLHVTYDVSAVGEAMSRVWIDPRPPPPEYPPFDINLLYETAFSLRREMKPYLDANTELEALAKWINVDRSRRAFAIACLLSLFVDCFLTVFHMCLTVVLLRNYVRKQQLDKLKHQAVQIFAKIDSDGNGEIDRAELGIALWDLIDKTKCECRPSENDMDNLFNKFANHNHRLELDDLIDLLMYCPKIVWGYDRVNREEAARSVIQDTESDDLSFSSADDDASDLDAAISEAVHPRDEGESSSSSSSGTSIFRRGTYRRRRYRTQNVPASSATEEKHADGASGPVKGVARKIINLAGRKYTGRSMAWATRTAMYYSSQLAYLREAFAWTNPKLSFAAVGLNLCFAYWHWVVPFRLSCLIASCLFFLYYTDKRRLVAKLCTEGQRAYERYRSLTTKTNLRFDLAVEDETNLPAIPHKTRGDARDHGLQAVIRGIFSRLDADGDGMVDAKELYDFILNAIPKATPEVQRRCAGHVDPQTQVHHMLERFNKHRGVESNKPIDLDALTVYVIQYGECSKLLVQDELRRQLETSGVKCLKLPSRHDYANPRHIAGAPRPHVFGAHQTLLTLRDSHLRYTNRRGYKISLASDMLLDVKQGNAPHIINVVYSDSTETKTLVFSIASVLVPSLLDLLKATFRDTIQLNTRKNPRALQPAVTNPHRDRRTALKPTPLPVTPRNYPQLATTGTRADRQHASPPSSSSTRHAEADLAIAMLSG